MNALHHITTLYQLGHTRCGLPEQQIAAAEQRLNIRFPAVLRAYLLTLGRSEAINQSCNRLLPLHEINITDGYLILIEENQDVCRWGIAIADLAQDNPPAHIAFYTAASGDYRWQPHLPDTCALLLELACINATMGGLPYCANIMNKEAIDAAAVRFIQHNRTEIKTLHQDNQQFYSDDFHDITLLCFADDGSPSGVFIGSADQDRFNTLLEHFGWDNWSYTTYDDEDDE